MNLALPVKVVDYIEPRLVDANGKTLACGVDDKAKETLTEIAAILNAAKVERIEQEPDF